MFTRQVILLALLLIHTSFHLEKDIARPCFGVNINIQGNSQILSFAAFFKNGNQISHKRIFKREEFIYVLSGEWPSIYNTNKANLFIEHQLNGGIVQDSFNHKKHSYCVPFDSLWKIRYASYPFRDMDAKGWANGTYKPSIRQLNYLINTYKISYIEYDYFMDDAFWQILHDVSDSTWIKSYKGM